MKRYTEAEIEAMSMATLDRTTGWLRRRSKEWNAAWKTLARKSGDADMSAEHRNECWQYMGSDCWRGYWAHHFRHRWHRTLGFYARIIVAASFGWRPKSELLKRK